MKTKPAVASRRSLLGLALLPVAALFGVSSFLLLSTPAHASTGFTQSSSCQTCFAYNTSTTFASTTTSSPGSTTSTTAAATDLTLIISYSDGIVTWQACGFPVGSTVQLYIGGVKITQSGGSGTVQANGCTTDPQFPVCLSPGNYAATAVDQPSAGGPVDSANATFKASSGGPACASVASVGGSLPFTGTDAFRGLIAGVAAIVLGLVVLQLNRYRRRSRSRG